MGFLLLLQNKCTQPEDVKLCALILKPASTGLQRKKVVSFLIEWIVKVILLVSQCTSWFPFLCVRPLWKRQWFTPSKVSQVNSCPRLRKIILLLLLLRPPPSLDMPRSLWPFQLDLPQVFPQLWHDQPFCLAHPPLKMAWGAVRDGDKTVEPEKDGELLKREREEDCLSRRNARPHRCLLLCLVRLGYSNHEQMLTTLIFY